MGDGDVAELSWADVVTWVWVVHRLKDAQQRVAEGPAAFQVRLPEGDALLVRKRTGEYWTFSADNDLHKARSDRRLRRALSRVNSLDTPAGVIFDPSQDVTKAQVQAWLDASPATRRCGGHIIDRGWAFLVPQETAVYGCAPGGVPRMPRTFAVIKRTGEVWDLLPGTFAESAYYATTESDFLSRQAGGWPCAWIPR
jgi:hypothetical protein